MDQRLTTLAKWMASLLAAQAIGLPMATAQVTSAPSADQGTAEQFITCAGAYQAIGTVGRRLGLTDGPELVDAKARGWRVGAAYLLGQDLTKREPARQVTLEMFTDYIEARAKTAEIESLAAIEAATNDFDKALKPTMISCAELAPLQEAIIETLRDRDYQSLSN